eukprot:gnl/Dysnectes_brevis/2277_a2671_1259.p1 GENE.gnl/Dysnectes_brevis/2277_a2671_1259~~gnl/Dysnectes_brevis/2277_a2671_1259.p1  ORF type:complete len:2036 (+),score=481.60 gnl/Dysnectes_brevis/2277_a2671_1259:452-6109(+)
MIDPSSLVLRSLSVTNLKVHSEDSLAAIPVTFTGATCVIEHVADPSYSISSTSFTVECDITNIALTLDGPTTILTSTVSLDTITGTITLDTATLTLDTSSTDLVILGDSSVTVTSTSDFESVTVDSGITLTATKVHSRSTELRPNAKIVPSNSNEVILSGTLRMFTGSGLDTSYVFELGTATRALTVIADDPAVKIKRATIVGIVTVNKPIQIHSIVMEATGSLDATSVTANNIDFSTSTGSEVLAPLYIGGLAGGSGLAETSVKITGDADISTDLTITNTVAVVGTVDVSGSLTIEIGAIAIFNDLTGPTVTVSGQLIAGTVSDSNTCVRHIISVSGSIYILISLSAGVEVNTHGSATMQFPPSVFMSLTIDGALTVSSAIDVHTLSMESGSSLTSSHSLRVHEELESDPGTSISSPRIVLSGTEVKVYGGLTLSDVTIEGTVVASQVDLTVDSLAIQPATSGSLVARSITTHALSITEADDVHANVITIHGLGCALTSSSGAFELNELNLLCNVDLGEASFEGDLIVTSSIFRCGHFTGDINMISSTLSVTDSDIRILDVSGHSILSIPEFDSIRYLNMEDDSSLTLTEGMIVYELTAGDNTALYASEKVYIENRLEVGTNTDFSHVSAQVGESYSDESIIIGPSVVFNSLDVLGDVLSTADISTSTLTVLFDSNLYTSNLNVGDVLIDPVGALRIVETLCLGCGYSSCSHNYDKYTEYEFSRLVIADTCTTSFHALELDAFELHGTLSSTAVSSDTAILSGTLDLQSLSITTSLVVLDSALVDQCNLVMSGVSTEITATNFEVDTLTVWGDCIVNGKVTTPVTTIEHHLSPDISISGSLVTDSLTTEHSTDLTALDLCLGCISGVIELSNEQEMWVEVLTIGANLTLSNYLRTDSLIIPDPLHAIDCPHITVYDGVLDLNGPFTAANLTLWDVVLNNDVVVQHLDLWGVLDNTAHEFLVNASLNVHNTANAVVGSITMSVDSLIDIDGTLIVDQMTSTDSEYLSVATTGSVTATDSVHINIGLSHFDAGALSGPVTLTSSAFAMGAASSLSVTDITIEVDTASVEGALSISQISPIVFVSALFRVVNELTIDGTITATGPLADTGIGAGDPTLCGGGSYAGGGSIPTVGIDTATYLPESSLLGSGGGSCGATSNGGRGGGAVLMSADIINLSGSISAAGHPGTCNTDGSTTYCGGSGSGGTIILSGQLHGTGSLSVSGGDSASSGAVHSGAGGGGVVSLHSTSTVGLTLDLLGGVGSGGVMSGDDGRVEMGLHSLVSESYSVVTGLHSTVCSCCMVEFNVQVHNIFGDIETIEFPISMGFDAIDSSDAVIVWSAEDHSYNVSVPAPVNAGTHTLGVFLNDFTLVSHSVVTTNDPDLDNLRVIVSEDAMDTQIYIYLNDTCGDIQASFAVLVRVYDASGVEIASSPSVGIWNAVTGSFNTVSRAAVEGLHTIVVSAASSSGTLVASSVVSTYTASAVTVDNTSNIIYVSEISEIWGTPDVSGTCSIVTGAVQLRHALDGSFIGPGVTIPVTIAWDAETPTDTGIVCDGGMCDIAVTAPSISGPHVLHVYVDNTPLLSAATQINQYVSLDGSHAVLPTDSEFSELVTVSYYARDACDIPITGLTPILSLTSPSGNSTVMLPFNDTELVAGTYSWEITPLSEGYTTEGNWTVSVSSQSVTTPIYTITLAPVILTPVSNIDIIHLSQIYTTISSEESLIIDTVNDIAVILHDLSDIPVSEEVLATLAWQKHGVDISTPIPGFYSPNFFQYQFQVLTPDSPGDYDLALFTDGKHLKTITVTVRKSYKALLIALCCVAGVGLVGVLIWRLVVIRNRKHREHIRRLTEMIPANQFPVLAAAQEDDMTVLQGLPPSIVHGSEALPGQMEL